MAHLNGLQRGFLTPRRRCPEVLPAADGKAAPVPYCSRHLYKGDGALKVHEHPKGYGKILVARFCLPKGYRRSFKKLRGLDQLFGSSI